MNPIWLSALDQQGSKSIILSWGREPEPDDYTTVDTYQLSTTTEPNVASTLLFKTQVSYKKMTDIWEGKECNAWGEASVDLRMGSAAP